ncbi:MAG: two-component sensor histidine kinase [Methylibium sp.]|uniref:sensor histidine kinase n=1 Tax=Methylibium sp. TaxID=2067992 RepID=UPI0018414157|nr:ATP-binding protein [Methylibium sp.]MBA2721683.1 two-component sensor histidine kinase [Methylibium sp.]MBA3625304.1 two-component sensor histidine kinase [Methylibium sp.]
MRANHASFDVFDAVFAVIPWPALMLGHDGAVMLTSEEVGVPAARPEPPPSLRERAGHYIAALRGEPPWLTPQEVDTTRALPSGEEVQERIILRRTDWGACLIVMAQTELRQLTGADIQAARLAALGFMVAGVCHEISNPLTSLHSVVQLLRSEKRPDDRVLEKGLSSIESSVKKILDISRRLVMFSRVGEEPRSQFAVDVAIDEALQVMRQEKLLDRIELQWSTDASALVFGNTGQLSEVFLNLFLNAAQAMDGSGSLSIRTVDAGNSVQVIVSDSGPGISEAVLARMFEPFFTTKPTGQGTGLGLAISSEIVLEHGGTLKVERSPAPGASFCVELPRERP